jgi:outer membrane protein assembly factor BamE (lipoprotein component of BamABCDE complex)
MTARLRHSLSLLGCSAALLLGACSKDVITHGYQVDQHRLAMIEPGTTSREEVARLLGTPSSIAPFDDQTWYYITQRYERANFFMEDLVAQDVYTVRFDDRGLVHSVQASGMENATEIDPDPDETRTMGNELSVVEQFLGNIGRFNTEAPGGVGSRRPGRPGGF